MAPRILHRGSNWTAREDRQLLDLLAVGKSWVLISVSLKRPLKSVQVRARHLKRKSNKSSV